MRCDVSTFPAAIAAGISAETTDAICREDANRSQQSRSERHFFAQQTSKYVPRGRHENRAVCIYGSGGLRIAAGEIDLGFVATGF